LSIEQYVTCTENCTLRYVEAMAMIGLLQEARVDNCEKPRFKRIIATLYNGRLVSTMCYFEDEVNHSIKIIQFYINLARKNNAIGKLTIIEAKREE
jgi:hypothetical protein